MYSRIVVPRVCRLFSLCASDSPLYICCRPPHPSSQKKIADDAPRLRTMPKLGTATAASNDAETHLASSDVYVYITNPKRGRAEMVWSGSATMDITTRLSTCCTGMYVKERDAERERPRQGDSDIERQRGP